MDKFRKIVGRIPTGLVSGLTLAAILWLTLAPHPAGDLELPLFPGADKVVHLVMFCFLTCVISLEVMKFRKWALIPLPALGGIAFLCSALGIGIEFIQRAMGLGRTFEILDILADSAGAFFGAGIWAVFQKFFAKPED